jgi:acyl-CoA reductase-like NAD-dependent aldehyde dehydrogenase
LILIPILISSSRHNLMLDRADSLIVHENVADRFVDLLKSHLSSRSARARDESPMTYRGLFNQASADKVNGLVEDAIQQGARLVAGSHHRTENIVQPVVLQGTSPSMKISSEEIFGPAMILNTFTTKEQAIEMANSSDYGLAASVYGVSIADRVPLSLSLPPLSDADSILSYLPTDRLSIPPLCNP